jgi:predicted Rossmann fold nucleotide-binding protein DprA/Smf involved in DNA uptake
MTNTIDKARRMIEERLAELEDEAKKLGDALVSLGHRHGKSSKAQPARKTKKRAKPGQREEQLLASVSKHPDYKPGEHAKAMGVSANQVYSLATRLQKEGKITKTAKGTYKVKKPATAPKKGS